MAESKGCESKSESKGSDTKGDAFDEDFMRKVQAFCMSNDIEQEFESFAKSHAHVFASAMGMKEGDEHPLQFHQAYLEYLEIFEKKIENYIISEGYTMKDFFKNAKYILDGGDATRSQRFFLETLMGISEYDQFFMLMKSELHVSTSERK
jgi:hypothetical protein